MFIKITDDLEAYINIQHITKERLKQTTAP